MIFTRTAISQIIDYILGHEEDIRLGINDFGDLLRALNELKTWQTIFGVSNE